MTNKQKWNMLLSMDLHPLIVDILKEQGMFPAEEEVPGGTE